MNECMTLDNAIHRVSQRDFKYFACVYVCVPPLLSFPRGQRMVLDPLELEMVFSPRVGPRN